jgi:hypothetical protein
MHSKAGVVQVKVIESSTRTLLQQLRSQHVHTPKHFMTCDELQRLPAGTLYTKAEAMWCTVLIFPLSLTSFS